MKITPELRSKLAARVGLPANATVAQINQKMGKDLEVRESLGLAPTATASQVAAAQRSRAAVAVPAAAPASGPTVTSARLSSSDDGWVYDERHPALPNSLGQLCVFGPGGWTEIKAFEAAGGTSAQLDEERAAASFVPNGRTGKAFAEGPR